MIFALCGFRHRLPGLPFAGADLQHKIQSGLDEPKAGTRERRMETDARKTRDSSLLAMPGLRLGPRRVALGWLGFGKKLQGAG
jgi:hypothetical protein